MRKIAPILIISLFILSLVLFFFAPYSYDLLFCNLCGTLFFIDVIIYLFYRKKKNYFDFDMLFFIAYFFVMFFFPMFMYENNPTRFFAFNYYYNENVISRATALSLVGITSYTTGSIAYRANSKKALYNIPKELPLNLFVIICFVLYIPSFIIDVPALIHRYSGGATTVDTSISGYINKISSPLLYSLILISFYKLQNRVSNFRDFIKEFYHPILIFSIILVLVVFSTGSRTGPLHIILLYASMYTILCKKMPLRFFIVYISLGFALMFSILIFRGYTVEFSIVDIFTDLIINNRNTFVAMDYVDQHGLSYGLTMLSPILSIIPLGQSIFLPIFGLSPVETSSSMLISKISLGTDDIYLGFGTNIIADIYMSFGVVGVIVIMLLMGYLVRKSFCMVKNNIYYGAFYAILCSYSVYIVRSELLGFVGPLLWTLIFVNIITKHPVRLVLKNTQDVFR